jgi:phosphopantothenoylcysteine decarboxylase / phosphopantothenate---cysteine ligase
MHPADEIRGMKGKILADKRIVLGITGSIAAVETIKLARELIRYGADVIPVMTNAATKIIHPDAIWFATGHKPVISLTGDTEHVTYCGKVDSPVDLFLISPCTANTISKIAHGIDDSSVTTFATTAIGAKHPVIIVPAMHQSMYNHEIVQKNITTLKQIGVIFIDPYIERNKAKMAAVDNITHMVIRAIGPKDLQGKKILIIGGSCAEPIDEVRCITNSSSGKTAITIAQTAFHHGGLVDLWYGRSPEIVPYYVPKKDFHSIKDVQKLISTTNFTKYDIIIVCAALSDYIPQKKQGKISSQKETVTITLKKSEKILPQIRSKAKQSILVGFKLDIDEKTVIEKAQQMKLDYSLDIVVCNTIKSIHTDSTDAWILKKTKIHPIKGSKKQLAEELFSLILP